MDASILEGQRVSIPKTSIPEVFHELLAEEGIRSKPAILFEGKSMTYEELDRISDAWCDVLWSGVTTNGKQQIIGVFVPPSDLRIISFLSIIKYVNTYSV